MSHFGTPVGTIVTIDLLVILISAPLPTVFSALKL